MDLGPFGLSEVVFIGLLALLLFGPRRLPELARSVGRVVTTLRRGTEELRQAFQEELDRSGASDALDGVRETGRELRRTSESLRATGRDLVEEGQRAVGIVREDPDARPRRATPDRAGEPVDGGAASGPAEPPGEDRAPKDVPEGGAS